MFSKDREMVWLRATRSQHTSATRITHQAAIRLGFAQSVTEAYPIQLRLSGEPRFVLRAEGVETLECIRSRSERGSDERMDSLGTDTPGSDRARHQMALEAEPKGRSPDTSTWNWTR